MFSIIGAILAIGFLILVHEGGHYFVARWCKMRVDRFSIGFGPPILTWTRGETDFTIGPIPFGGFVQINGMTMVDEIDPDDPRQYPNRPVWQRFATIFAGPATNYLAAIAFALVLYNIAGVRTGTTWYLVAGLDERVAKTSALQTGDQILKINDRLVYNSYEKKRTKSITEHVQDSKGEEMSIVILRDGQEMTVRQTPYTTCGFLWYQVNADDLDGTTCINSKHRIGIRLGIKSERVQVSFLSAVGAALYYPVEQTQVISSALYKIVSGQEKGEFSSVVGIASEAKKRFDAGWIDVFTFMMLLNVYLGLFNLLPFPALDGGRLVFLVYEMTTRRRANPKVESMVHMVGIMVLLVVVVLVTYQDIVKLL